NRAFGNLSADWIPSTWLSFKYTLGVDSDDETRLQAIPKTSSSFATGQVISLQFNQTQIDHNLVGTATWGQGTNFGRTLVLGQNLNARRFQQEFVQGNTLLADRPFKLTNTLQQVNVSDAETQIHTEGYFGQSTFDIYNQLYLTLGLRNDGSSTFSDDSRRNWFPKASAAWTFTNYLSTLGLNRALSFGKLRAAYGEVGQEPGAYQLLSVLQAGANFTDGGWGTQVQATQNNIAALFSSAAKGQPKIKPERTTEFETGMDVGLFGDRADAGLTFYNALSRDVIFQTPLAPSSGFTQQVQNAGRIRNRGWEATFNVRPITLPNFSWDLGLQWATNDNKVLQLVGAQFVNMTGSFAGAVGAATLGGRVGGLRGFDWVRCGRGDVSIGESGRGVTTDQVSAACTGATNGALFIAADGFPVVDGTERQISDPQPKWTGSINNGLTFKKLHVTSLVDIKHGGQVWNGTKGALYFFGTHEDTEDGRVGQKIFGQTWNPGETVVGPGANKPVYLVCPPNTSNCNGNGITNWFQGNGGGFGSQSAQFIEDGGYVKLREIALAYLFDQRWVGARLGLSSVEVKIAGRNLHTWTKYTGWDPETNLGGAEVGISGVDFFNNPQTRSFVLTMTLNR
ncbi:MAG TPA: TonB-dependent receptor, partial [Gemmatimonadaceae bacterium]